jgi:single-strand DNA-binding protein
MINRVVLAGNITRDPQLNKTQTGLSVIKFTVAINRKSKGQDLTDFINCVAWNQTAEFVGQYVKKGYLVGVDGRLTTSNYDDKDGKKVYVTEVSCDNVQILNSRNSTDTRPTTTTPSPKQNTGYFPDEPSVQDEDFNTGPLLDISSDDLPF